MVEIVCEFDFSYMDSLSQMTDVAELERCVGAIERSAKITAVSIGLPPGFERDLH